MSVGGLPKIHADDRAAHQILLNLLSNVIKFTPASGEAKVSACLDSQGWVEITIADNDVGIAREDMEVILLTFSQVDSNNFSTEGGTGLGLSIVNSLVELQGSKLGEGTCVTVHFPKSRILHDQRSHC